MTNLIDPPNKFTLPLSRGRDLYCVFVYKPLVVDEEGEPVLDGSGNRQYAVADYPEGSTVMLVIDDTEAIEIEATIDGSNATVWEDHATVDAVKAGKLWRTVITYADGLDDVLCNGTTIREDGK